MSDTQPPEPGSQPDPYRHPSGQPYGQPAGTPYGGQPHGAPAPAGLRDGGSDRRPGTVTAAAVITIVTSALVLLAGLGFGVLGAVGSEAFYDGVRDGGRGAYDDFDNGELQTLVLAIGVVFAVWSAAAILLGVLVLRRSSVARVLLVISASLSLVLSLLGILSLVSVVTFIAAVAVIVLLFVGGANDWFARRAPVQPWS